MDMTLLDAAFRLVSHSLQAQDARAVPLLTDEARLAELRRQFPQADARAVAEAYARARRLEDTAVALADAAHGPGDGRRGPPLTWQALAERCPGFSDASYGWAVNDGFILTRK
jgi:hypothetical protein